MKFIAWLRTRTLPLAREAAILLLAGCSRSELDFLAESAAPTSADAGSASAEAGGGALVDAPVVQAQGRAILNAHRN